MKLKKIIFDVNGKEVSLTEEEARELHNELSKLFCLQPAPTTPWIYPSNPWTTYGEGTVWKIDPSVTIS